MVINVLFNNFLAVEQTPTPGQQSLFHQHVLPVLIFNNFSAILSQMSSKDGQLFIQLLKITISSLFSSSLMLVLLLTCQKLIYE